MPFVTIAKDQLYVAPLNKALWQRTGAQGTGTDTMDSFFTSACRKRQVILHVKLTGTQAADKTVTVHLYPIWNAPDGTQLELNAETGGYTAVTATVTAGTLEKATVVSIDETADQYKVNWVAVPPEVDTATLLIVATV